jgi:hypothetical protein
MIDFVGEKISESVDSAIHRMVVSNHFRAGSIVSMPVTYPSGSTVVIEITVQQGKCFISDRGSGYQEAELLGSSRYYKREAKRIAESVGIRFDGRDMFVAEVERSNLHGAMIVVANSSAQAVNFAAMRQAERTDKDAAEDLYFRLSSIYGEKSVAKDAEVIGASNHKWRVSVLVNRSRQRAFFEPVTSNYISVVGTAAKFHDFVRVDNPPQRIAVIKSRDEIGDFYGVVAAASSQVITMSAADRDFRDLLSAA